VQDAIRRVLLYMLEAVDDELWFLEAWEVSKVMRCVLLRMLEAVEGGLYLLEAMEAMGVLGDDASCAALYAGGRGGRALFAGGYAPRATLYAGGGGGWALGSVSGFRNFHCGSSPPAMVNQ